VSGGVDATVTDALNNPIINKLRSQYLDLINREADWSKRFGANHQRSLTFAIKRGIPKFDT